MSSSNEESFNIGEIEVAETFGLPLELVLDLSLVIRLRDRLFGLGASLDDAISFSDDEDDDMASSTIKSLTRLENLGPQGDALGDLSSPGVTGVLVKERTPLSILSSPVSVALALLLAPRRESRGRRWRC